MLYSKNNYLGFLTTVLACNIIYHSTKTVFKLILFSLTQLAYYTTCIRVKLESELMRGLRGKDYYQFDNFLKIDKIIVKVNYILLVSNILKNNLDINKKKITARAIK